LDAHPDPEAQTLPYPQNKKKVIGIVVNGCFFFEVLGVLF
jgi:hypothetical protein